MFIYVHLILPKKIQLKNKSILTLANTVKWYIDCVSKSSGPNKNIVPSVFSGDIYFCRIANNGEPHNSSNTCFGNNGFFLAIT